MKTRTIGNLLTTLALVAVAQLASAQEIVLKVHHFLPTVAIEHRLFIVPWCDKIAKESNNRLKCEIYPSMQLGGSPAQLIDQVRDGVADIVWSIPTYQAGRFIKTEVFELPFMTKSAQAASPALLEYYQKHSLDEFKGTKLITIHTLAGSVLFLTNKRPRTMEDLKGLKVRVPNRLAVKTATALGMVPVQMPVTAIAEALSKNVVDGDLSTWEASNMMGMQEITKVNVEVPKGFPRAANFVGGMFMNQAKYDSLPADLKKVIDQNSGIEMTKWSARLADDEERIGRKVAEDRKNTSIVISVDEYNRWKKATDSIKDEWIKEVTAKGANGKALYEEAVSLLNKYGG